MSDQIADAVSSNVLRAGLRREQAAAPCAVVIFGALGDLTRRKLVPALYNLLVDRLLPSGFAIVGVGRQAVSREVFASELRAAVEEHSRRPLDPQLWRELEPALSLVAAEPDDYSGLAAHLATVDAERGTAGNRLYYLATPPAVFADIVEGLGGAGLARPRNAWARVVIEKPIGQDLASARELNRRINAAFPESAVFRIDHYLGKETVQNLLVFRFANSIFEPLWNQKYVDHVQITVAESIGIEGRGRYFDQAGMTRDVVQNHLMQLLCLTACEPPGSMRADAIRNEKVKVLEAIRPIDPARVQEVAVRGQYGPGVAGGERVPGYHEEPDVAGDSTTESYVALRLHVDNWRWGGVPFYIRAGKRLTRRVTEIALRFRDVPHPLFERDPGTNTLALRIQPDEGITLSVDAKRPGPRVVMRPVTMEFRYGTAFGQSPPEAYERLLLDAMIGDSTLFIRRDEVEGSWRIIDELHEGWRRKADRALPSYAAGSWGPVEADALLERDGRAWRRP